MIQYTQIEQLLARFVDGQTSEAEEEILADYFRSAKDVPEEWKAYQALFASFDSDAFDFTDKELDEMCLPVEDDGDGDVVGRSHSRFFVRWRLGAAAAVLLFGVIGAATYVISSRFSQSDVKGVEASVSDGGDSSSESVMSAREDVSVAFDDEEECAHAAVACVRETSVSFVDGRGDGHENMNDAAYKAQNDVGTVTVNDSVVYESSVEAFGFDEIMAEVRMVNEYVDMCMRNVQEVARMETEDADAACESRVSDYQSSSCASPVGMEMDEIDVPEFPRMQ